MPHIGDVLDVLHIYVVHLKRPANPVRHQIRPKIANVRVTINRWPTCVHLDYTRFNRVYFLDSLGQSVV